MMSFHENQEKARASLTLPQDVLAEIVDWWDTIATLREDSGRQVVFATDYESGWLAMARRFATKQ